MLCLEEENRSHMTPSIEIVEFDGDGNELTAETFLDYLRPSKDHWHTDMPMEPEGNRSGFPMYVARSQWCFRGQWNADNWSLTPSSWRETMRPRVELAIADGKANGLRDDQISEGNFWLNAEASILRAFHRALEEFGYPVPRFNSSNTYYAGFSESENEDYVDIAGLAQHHGIPTRLLDWTLDPLTAAYFGASESFRAGEADKLCVWALNLRSPLVRDDGRETGFLRESQIVVRKQSRHVNDYLRAQKGLFTEVSLSHGGTDYGFFDRCGRWPSLEEVVRDSYAELDDSLKGIATPTLRKVVLRESEADRLCERLSREGYKKAILMPTLDNLAADVLGSWAG